MNLAQEVNQEWLVRLEDPVSLVCLVKQEDKVHLDLLECQELKVLMDLEVHQAVGDLLVPRECLGWKE